MSSNATLKDNYDLALKLFASRNFNRSYEIISQLINEVYAHFATVNPQLFVKIVSLYLVEVGTFLGESSSVMSKEERSWNINVLKSNEMIDRWVQLFGGLDSVPLELLCNYHLVFRTQQTLLLSDENVKNKYLRELGKLYTVLCNRDDHSHFDDMLLNLYVFEILPSLGEFDLAHNIVLQNGAFSDDIKTYTDKLEQIKKDKALQAKQAKEKAAQEARAAQEAQKRELEKQAELEKEKNLRYRSVRELRKQYASESGSEYRESSPSSRPSTTQIEMLKNRLVYLYGITKTYVKKNYPMLAALLLILIGASFLGLKKYKIRENLVETIRMAFKINYL